MLGFGWSATEWRVLLYRVLSLRYGNQQSAMKLDQSKSKCLEVLCVRIPTDLPAHACVLQAFDSCDGPLQLFPPLDAGGLLQVLLRYCIPPPQGLLHEPNALQDVQ